MKCSCGSTDVVFLYGEEHGDVGWTWVQCGGCGKTSTSVRGHDEVGALKKWKEENVS